MLRIQRTGEPPLAYMLKWQAAKDFCTDFWPISTCICSVHNVHGIEGAINAVNSLLQTHSNCTHTHTHTHTHTEKFTVVQHLVTSHFLSQLLLTRVTSPRSLNIVPFSFFPVNAGDVTQTNERTDRQPDVRTDELGATRKTASYGRIAQ